MNILGEGFNPKIINQIDTRQHIFGLQNKTGEVLSYLYGNTAWVKLMSSVSINREKITNFTHPEIYNLGLFGDALSKKFILFNGTKDINAPQRSGIPTSNTNWINANTAYGVGGNDFGIKPMPGIMSATIQTLTNGTLKTSTIQIKAWNKTQFDIIDILYLRLGYTVLLEWGWSNFYKGTPPVFQAENPYSMETDWFGTKYNYNTILDKIQRNRIDSEGNYDAIFGKVVNFSWSFNTDGSYDITVIVRSVGDVIESLKMNILNRDSDKLNQTTNNTQTTKGDADNIKSYANKSNIGQLFSNVVDAFNQTSTSNNLSAGINSLSGKNIVSPNANNDTTFLTTGFRVNPSKNGMSSITIDPSTQIVDFVSQNWNGNGTTYYIRLGSFLKWLEKKQVYVINQDKENLPLINFDYDVESNLIFIPNEFISVNPQICIFNRKFTSYEANDNQYEFFQACSNGKEPISSKINNGNKYLQIMEIYINMEFILSTIDSYLGPNHDGNAYLIDLLKEICNGICSSTGNLNKLKPVIDETTNTLRIIDESQLPDRNTLISAFGGSNSEAIFQVYGFNNQTSASFVQNFQMRTEISPELSTIISVGSAANNFVPGEDATALSRMNVGLTDRYKQFITDPSQKQQNNTEPETLEKKYINTINDYYKFLKTLRNQAPTKNIISKVSSYEDALQNTISPNKSKVSFTENIPSWNISNFSDYSSVQRTLLEYEIALASVDPKNNGASYTTGFIPFNLALTVLGISGMKVFQRYNINNSFLPSNYSLELEFIIKTKIDTIQNNYWTSVIESIGLPKHVNGKLGQPQISQNIIKDIQRSELSCKIQPPNIPSYVTPNMILLALINRFFSNFTISLNQARIIASALVGNFQAESSLNLNAFNNDAGCGAYGLAQWRNPRQNSLSDFAKGLGIKYDTLDGQASYIIHELKSLYYTNVMIPSLNIVNDITINTIEDKIKQISYIVSKYYEGFAGSNDINNPEVIKRQINSINIYNTYTKSLS